jgi:hypothetical protein
MESEMKTSVKIGDRVAYARHFLQSTGQFTGRSPFARGTVDAIHDGPGPRIVHVQWDARLVNGETVEPRGSTVLEWNLVLVDRIHLEPC